VSTSEPEPKGSTTSSGDEDLCFCGHKRAEHSRTQGDYSGCIVVIDGRGNMDSCTRFRLAPPLEETRLADLLPPVASGGETREGAVCAGGQEVGHDRHRPTAVGKDGRCFVCEPLIAAEEPVAIVPTGLPPVSLDPLPAYAVTYAVNGGQSYEIAIPGDASVVVEDGILKVYHPGRPALGIVSIRTQPELAGGEPHDVESPHDH